MLDQAHAFLWEALGPAFLDSETPVEVSDDTVCECCDRPARRWVKNKAYTLKCNYTGNTLMHCPSCRVLSIQSPRALGKEREAGGTPVYMKLTSFKSGWLLLEEGEQPRLWAGGLYTAKIPTTVFKVEGHSGNAALLRMLDNPPAGKSLIVELGLRRERIARNLALNAPGQLQLSTATGVIDASGAGWTTFSAALADMPLSERRQAIPTLRAFVEGRLAPADPKLQSLWETAPALAAASQDLPTDPHGRLMWLSAGAAL